MGPVFPPDQGIPPGLDSSPDMGPPPWLPPGEGPWKSSVVVRTSSDGVSFGTVRTIFPHAGVPHVLHTTKGDLIAVFQNFSYSEEALFNVIAYSVSSDDGATWSAPKKLVIKGITAGGPSPCDPTLVELSDHSLRIYFTYDDVGGSPIPVTASAMALAGSMEFTLEAGARFEVKGAMVLDPSVVLYKGKYHLFALNFSRAGQARAYHATSLDGLTFTREKDILSGLTPPGNPMADSNGVRFYGTNFHVCTMAYSADGSTYKQSADTILGCSDPAVVQLSASSYLMLSTE